MTFAQSQQLFMAHILDEDQPVPTAWDARFVAGMDVYRNAYRTRLIDALAETFPRTAKWVGEDSFSEAAAHYLILFPPNGWTLDLIGEGFPETLSSLFANDPEVAELAWLEWAMHVAYTASDDTAMDAEQFATATVGFSEQDWIDMRVAFVAGTQCRAVGTNCVALWQGLEGDAMPDHVPKLGAPANCLVWRDGLSPVFQLTSSAEGDAFTLMAGGASFGMLCENLAQNMNEEDAAAAAGGFLGQWIARGMIAAVR
jgi:hypothetical protein